MNISLLFILHWMGACCQDISNLIVRKLTSQGLSLLSYTDDLGGMASTEAEATSHFTICMLYSCSFLSSCSFSGKMTGTTI